MGATCPQPSSPRVSLETLWGACDSPRQTGHGRQGPGRSRLSLKAAAVSWFPDPLWNLKLLFQNSLPSPSPAP